MFVYYFASQKNFNGQILTPKVPDNRLTKKGWEENVTPRICVSKSLIGCIESAELHTRYKRLYVHTCSSDNIMQPSMNQVGDAYLTGEEWVLEPVKIKLSTILHITKEPITDQISRWNFKNKEDVMVFSIYGFDHDRYYNSKQ